MALADFYRELSSSRKPPAKQNVRFSIFAIAKIKKTAKSYGKNGRGVRKIKNAMIPQVFLQAAPRQTPNVLGAFNHIGKNIYL
ncbi:MAG: hypothetical protein ACLRFM_00855 [Alphaproteobacteria bacterium]